MSKFLLSAMLGMGIASAQAQVACPTISNFAGSKDQAVLQILDQLKGTVAMSGNNVCSGALVTFKGRSSSAPALVLSAAHCSDRGKIQIPLRNGTLAALDAGEVLYRVEYRRPLTLDTGNSDAPRTCIESEEIVYATLTDGDILLLRLGETYDQIERRTGVRPFLISQDQSFPAGLALRMPSSLWQNDRACEIEATVEKLKEHRWVWGPVIRLRRMNPDSCLAPHGASGSPAIRKDTNEVIGVLGTSSDATGAPCELNNPCEVKPDGTVVAMPEDQSYVHFVHKLYSCLDAERNIDLGTPGCLLPRPQP